jgi:hypothetical protein
MRIHSNLPGFSGVGSSAFIAEIARLSASFIPTYSEVPGVVLSANKENGFI